MERTDPMVATIRSAAKKLTGFRRRQFLAEVAVKYCDGMARRTEYVFGLSRDAVQLGLHELRTGIRCLDDFSARGRKRTEVLDPDLEKKIHAVVEPVGQADPKFQTAFTYTRITAAAVHKALADQAAETDQPLPHVRTISTILNRLGYRLRRVRKTVPRKKFP